MIKIESGGKYGLKTVLRPLLLCLCLIPSLLCAATFTEIPVDEVISGGSGLNEDIRYIVMDGPVEHGDAQRFRAIASDSDKVTLVLKGPGGLTAEAYQIGAEVNLRGYATLVLPETVCLSSCALIWVSGAQRYMSESSVIGFHQVYSGDGIVSGQGNTENGAYLQSLNLPLNAIKYFSSAPPEGFEYLSPTAAWVLGIEIYLQDGLDVITPLENPSLPTLARHFSGMGLMISRCSTFMSYNETRFAQEMERVGAVPNAVAGDLWTEAFLVESDRIKQRAADLSDYVVCAELETELLSYGYELGVSGPSFNCSRATSVDEHAICGSDYLAALDRGMAGRFAQARRSNDQGLATEQRSWLSLRSGCGQNTNCIESMYVARFQQLSALVSEESATLTRQASPISPRPTNYPAINLNDLSFEEATILQLGLALYGFYDGMQDGDWGRRSGTALSQHQRHLENRGIAQDQLENLIDTLRYEYGQFGWEYGDHHGIGASYLFPASGAVQVDPFFSGGQSYVWENSVRIAVGNLGPSEASRLHLDLLNLHERWQGDPYQVRRNNLLVSVARVGDEFHHLRSERSQAGWSTLYVHSGPDAAGYYTALVGSFSISRPRSFSLFDQLLILD